MGSDAIMKWAQHCLHNYPGITANSIDDDAFTNGIAFCCIIHWYAPRSIKLDQLKKHNTQENFKQAFCASWELFRIPHVIQSFNINKVTLTMYLALLFSYLKDKQRVCNLRFCKNWIFVLIIIY